MEKVYFTKEISSESLIKIYEKLGCNLEGKVAVKISTGEAGNNHYLKPSLINDLVKKLNGTIVECNTAYEGKRNTTKDHLQTITEHGFTNVDLLDIDGDKSIPVLGGRHLKENYVGKNIDNYDSMLMLSHFKGHPMGGFGGALKNMSIGLASSRGKAWIHSGGVERDNIWTTPQVDFIESMAEADKAVVDYFKNIVYVNVVNNLSVDCDCCAVAEDPCLADIGMLASLDPIALDQACIDLVYSSNDAGKQHFIDRVESRNGLHTVESAAKHGFGMCEYELIDID